MLYNINRKESYSMAKKDKTYQDAHTANIKKVGKPRTSKLFRRKGNASSRTVKSGSGKRIR